MAQTSTVANSGSNSNTGSTPYLDRSTAFDAWHQSKLWMTPYFDPIDEYERLARNKPSERLPKGYPRVTDGTIAAIIQEQPKRIIQQMATGVVECYDFPGYAKIADIVHRYKIIPQYNRQGSAIQKQWNMQSKTLTWGRAASYTFFTSTDDIFHTDYTIPYVKDVITEKGKVFAGDSNYAFMRSWFQKSDIQAIIAREQALKQQNPSYQSGWNLQLLAELINGSSQTKPADQMTPAEKERGVNAGGYEIIHVFQKGKNSEFYSFAPNFADNQPIRVKINDDPRGHIPLNFEYCNIDLSNPLGRGVSELSGGVQNLIDQQMQMFQFMTTLEMAPPMQVWGQVNTASIKFRPNALWKMGNNPNNKVEPYVVSNNAIGQFSNNYGLLKSQILNLNSNSDNSISSEVGPNQSKTQAGVQAQETKLGVSDNYLRGQHEAWLQDQEETSINIYFANMAKDETVLLKPQDLTDLMATPESAQFLTPDGKLHVPYSRIKDITFKFEVDATSSKSIDDADQLQKLQELIQEVGENGPVLSYYLAQAGMKLNVGELYKQQIERLGLRNIDSILATMEPEEAEQAKQQPFPIIDKPQIRINSADLSPAELIAALQAGGVNIDPQSQQPLDPVANASAQAQLDYHVELAKAQGSASAGATNPDELALKQQELALKQRAADQNDVKTALEVSKTAHQHALDLHNAAQGVGDQQFQQQQAIQQQQLDAQAQQQSQTEEQSEPASESASEAASGQPEPANEATQQPASPSTESGPQAPQPDQSQGDGLHHPDPQEQQIVEALLHQGFSESDVEQAIVMLRQGVPAEQVLQALRGKYAGR